MIDMDISFGDSPWEAWMDRKRYGDSLSAAQLLTFLEEETEEGVEEAFAALEDRGLKLDVTTLPSGSSWARRPCGSGRRSRWPRKTWL